MIIYKGIIMGETATIKKVHVKNKQQFINMLNDAMRSDSNLQTFTDEEEPYGEIYEGNKKELKESIKEYYFSADYTSYTITESSQHNK